MRKMPTLSAVLLSVSASATQIRLLYGSGNANENRPSYHDGNKKAHHCPQCDFNTHSVTAGHTMELAVASGCSCRFVEHIEMHLSSSGAVDYSEVVVLSNGYALLAMPNCAVRASQRHARSRRSPRHRHSALNHTIAISAD